MMASKKVNEGHRRLGDTTGEVSMIKGIEAVDASAVKTDLLGHSYFAENGSVVSDIFYLFRTSLRPELRFNMKGVASSEDGTGPFSRTSVLPEAVSALLMRGLSGSRARRLGRWKAVGELRVNLPHDASLGRDAGDDQQQVACQPQ